MLNHPYLSKIKAIIFWIASTVLFVNIFYSYLQGSLLESDTVLCSLRYDTNLKTIFELNYYVPILGLYSLYLFLSATWDIIYGCYSRNPIKADAFKKIGVGLMLLLWFVVVPGILNLFSMQTSIHIDNCSVSKFPSNFKRVPVPVDVSNVETQPQASSSIKSVSEKTDQKSVSDTTKNSSSTDQLVDNSENLKTYENERFGFSLKYPRNYQLNVSEKEEPETVWMEILYSDKEPASNIITSPYSYCEKIYQENELKMNFLIVKKEDSFQTVVGGEPKEVRYGDNIYRSKKVFNVCRQEEYEYVLDSDVYQVVVTTPANTRFLEEAKEILSTLKIKI